MLHLSCRGLGPPWPNAETPPQPTSRSSPREGGLLGAGLALICVKGTPRVLGRGRRVKEGKQLHWAVNLEAIGSALRCFSKDTDAWALLTFSHFPLGVQLLFSVWVAD